MILFIIKLIALAVFNISFFTITKANCAFSMWVSYGFIHFSFLMFFLAPLLTRKNSKSRHVAIESLELVTTLYFISTLVAGLFFLTHPFLVLYQYSIESFITGIYLIVFIATFVMNNNIANNESQSEAEKQFLSNIYVKAEFIKSKQSESDIKELIEKLQEDSRYSQTKSNPNVKDLESKILTILDEVTANIDNQDKEETISKITNCRDLLKQRNLMLRKN